MISEDNNIKLAIVATMSSGKSTLINSFLGKELMPSKSEACTAKIIKINNTNKNNFKFIDIDGVSEDREASLEDLKEINIDENINEVTIEGKVNSFNRFKNIQLIDTPGPNNSLNLRHKETTMDFLQKNLVDIILFVLDGSKLLTDDEDYLLQKVIEETSGKIDENNIIFVVNKSDDFKGEDNIELIKKNVVDKIKSYGIKSPKVQFISAYYAFLSIMKEFNYTLTMDQEDELLSFERKIKRKSFYKSSDVTNNIKRKIEDKESKVEANELIKLKSGFLGLELTLIDIVNKIHMERSISNKMKVKLKCNPYKKENLIEVDGEICNKSKLLKYRNLYAYELGESFLTDLVDELNNKLLIIEFYGTRYDFQDITELVKLYNEKYNTEISVIEDKVVDILDKRKEIEDLVVTMLNSNISELRDEELINGVYKELNNPVKVAVIATMSSGKSTLINSMIAEKIMPSKSGACTSKIVTISNRDIKEFKLISIDGVEENKVINIEDMKSLNDKEGIKEIEIEGNIKALNEIKNLQLIDTPGPNNSLNGTHKKRTMEYIKSGDKPIILFILDGSKLLTDDEAYLIEVIADETKRDGKVDEERFIFAINKADDFKSEDSISKIKEDVKRKLKEYGIENPNIHFIAAENALLSRLDDNGVKLSEDQEDDLFLITRKASRGTYKFYLESDLSLKVRTEIERIAEGAKGNQQVLVTSGILGLELTIKELTNKYKNISLVRNSIEDCSKIIKEKNILKNIKNQIQMKEEEMKELEENIIKIKNFLNENDVREDFKNDINNMKFKDTFRLAVNRVHINLSKLEKNAKNMNVESISGIQCVKKIEAERYMKELMKKYEDITIDLQSEFDRFIQYGIYEVGEKVIQEYKNKLEGFINILSCKDNMLNEYVKSSVPDYKVFIKKNTINKSESYTEYVLNSEKQGFFGKLKFWKPKYVEVYRKRNIEVIEIKEILKFTTSIFKELDGSIRSMTESIEKHKEKAKEILISNLDKLNLNIDNKLNSLKEVIDNKAEMEVAITIENDKLNTIEVINEKLEKILTI